MSDSQTEVSFVRQTPLPAKAPPATEQGVLKWARENLFATPLNGVLTIAALYAIYLVLAGSLPWILGGLWTTSSLAECREVFAANWAPGFADAAFGLYNNDALSAEDRVALAAALGGDISIAGLSETARTGALADQHAVAKLFAKYGVDQSIKAPGYACFSVLTERWNQLLFGFNFPADQYWRPITAFVLMFVAIAPVLFFDLPRKLLIFTAIYPFLAFWLFWGGAFWLPLLIILGFVLAYYAYKYGMQAMGDSGALIAGIAVLVLWLSVGLGLATSAIDRMVGSARMESRTTTLLAEQEAIATEVETLSARNAELSEQLDALLTPVRAENPLDPKKLRAALKEGYPLRKELSQGSRKIGLLNSDLSDNKSLLGRIKSLPELEASLPELRKTAETLRADLPASVSDVLTEEGLENLVESNREQELGITLADLKLAEDALKAESSVKAAERTISVTYADVARIGLEPITSRQMGGFMLNMMLGLTCVSLSLPLGIALALGRQSSMPLIKWMSVIFIEFIRGVPLITLLFVANVMLAYFFPPGSGVDLFIRVVIMITMFSAAYIAEVIRGGLAALPKGQYEAADSLGLDYAQAMRLIILPQALKISIPGIVNIAVGLFKDTTLVSVISMFDLIGMIRGPILASTEWNGVYWELFGFAAVLFFVVCYGISQYSQWLERRLATDHH